MFLFDGINWALSARDSSSRDASSTTILRPKVSWNSHFVEYNVSTSILTSILFALLVGCRFLY